MRVTFMKYYSLILSILITEKWGVKLILLYVY